MTAEYRTLLVVCFQCQRRCDSFKSDGEMIVTDTQGLTGLAGIYQARIGERQCYQSQVQR